MTSGSAELLHEYRFRSSSAVERPPVKRLVVGSIPTSGAKKLDANDYGIILYMRSRIVYSIFAILFGAFMFVYGEIDDSPGGQLLGLLVVIVGIVGIIKSKKRTSN